MNILMIPLIALLINDVISYYIEIKNDMKIYETNVKINLKTLRDEVSKLKVSYDEIGSRDSHEGRSRFSSWNNINHFLKSIDDGSDFKIIPVEGTVSGSSARVYYHPSITSLSKQFRKCIEPVKTGNVFVYFDCKAAEFFLNCVFCNEKKAIDAYLAGNDIYMQFSDIFPSGTSREVIKRCLIGNMYGVTSYRVALQCGITENQADRLLRTVAMRQPNVERAKFMRISNAKRLGYYVCPSGFDQSKLVKVADFNEKTGFNANMALSAYVQSALGLWMQSLIGQVKTRINGTLLSVFDSMFVEIKPENKDRFVKWVSSKIYPFRAGEYCVGKTMYEAQYSNK